MSGSHLECCNKSDNDGDSDGGDAGDRNGDGDIDNGDSCGDDDDSGNIGSRDDDGDYGGSDDSEWILKREECEEAYKNDIESLIEEVLYRDETTK